jgi:hypothetical protein
MLVIDGCGSLSLVQNNVENIKEDNLKVGNLGRTISQTPTLGLEQDKFQA